MFHKKWYDKDMKIIEFKIKDDKNIYQEITKALCPYKNKKQGSTLFIVEGTKGKPIIGIRYPGKKVVKRQLTQIRSNSCLWGNLYDFEVVPFLKKENNNQKFTFEEIMRDFQEHKIKSREFWLLIEELYKNNTTTKKIPELNGIDARLFLLVLKWIWIQEDFNYKFNWKEVSSPIKYRLQTRTGTSTSRGAGRAKFFAALILLKYGFTFEQVKKIIPLY